MNAIETRQLSRSFGKVRAVDSATLEVPAGTVFGLLGSNGAGKSTLLKLLVGHLRPSFGTATVLGAELTPGKRPRWESLGYVSQARYLPAWMTAAECLRFAKTFRWEWDDEKVSKLITRLEVPLETRIREMSRGNYVRLQIGLAMAHNPELILLDEPTAGLDPVGRRELLGLLIDEISLRGCTVVLSSHNVEEIERMADHLAIMDRGGIVAHGPVDAVKKSRQRVQFRTALPEPDLATIPGLVALQRSPEAMIAVTSSAKDALQFLHSRGADEAIPMATSLEQTFFEYIQKPAQ
jgi:ABC-2 type transport system ATP-binding protein